MNLAINLKYIYEGQASHWNLIQFVGGGEVHRDLEAYLK